MAYTRAPCTYSWAKIKIVQVSNMKFRKKSTASWECVLPVESRDSRRTIVRNEKVKEREDIFLAFKYEIWSPRARGNSRTYESNVSPENGNHRPVGEGAHGAHGAHRAHDGIAVPCRAVPLPPAPTGQTPREMANERTRERRAEKERKREKSSIDYFLRYSDTRSFIKTFQDMLRRIFIDKMRLSIRDTSKYHCNIWGWPDRNEFGAPSELAVLD